MAKSCVPGDIDRLSVVAGAAAAFDEARDALHRAVREALDDGATWSDIGAVLGVSRQAAFQRFGPKQATPPSEDAEPGP
jgi:Flp pilus assembly protein TadD